MDSLGYSKEIFYFKQEGKINLEKTIEIVVERALESNIKKILIFTSDGEGAIRVREKLIDRPDIQVIAVAFPQHFTYIDEEDGKKVYKNAPTSERKTKEKLTSLNIPLVQGIMALEDIFIPGTKDIKLITIEKTLGLISGGLELCVEAILMSCDSGYVEQDEDVIAMSADTAILASACKKLWLFHPDHGLEIKEVLCKPMRFTISKGKYTTKN